MKKTFLYLSVLFVTQLIGVEEIKDFKLDPLYKSEVFETHSIANRIIVVDFFAQWCKPCAKLTPKLHSKVQHLKSTLGSGIDLILANIDDDKPDKTIKFLERHNVDHAWQDVDASVYQEISKNRGLPFVAVIKISDEPDRKLELLYAEPGEPDWNSFLSIIEEAGKDLI